MAKLKFCVSETSWNRHQNDLITIRTKVFIDEQQVSDDDEWDNLDQQAAHFVVILPCGKAIGCARVLEEQQHGQTLFRIGRVAVLREYRRQGVGQALMHFVINSCSHRAPAQTLYLHAQITRQAFYTSLGFVAQGEPFLDAGMAHIAMWLNPKQE